MFLEEYEKNLQEISKAEQIFSLEDPEIKFDEKNTIQFADLIERTRLKLNTDGCIDLLISDLIESISPNIKFALANVYLYSSNANNFLKELKNSNGQIYATYNQTLHDKRFFYYVNSTFEKLYNFWDRIGDILAMALNLPMEGNIYFGMVIDKIERMNIASVNFKWLKEFKQSEYTPYLNKLRIKIVHDRQKDSYFRFEVGVSNLANDENTKRVRAIIEDAFGGGRNGWDLQCTEYVQFKIKQDLGVTIAWPVSRGRNGGKWAQIFQEHGGYQVLDEPKEGCSMSFTAGLKDLEVGHVAYVEKCYPDGSIKTTEANWPGSGRFLERVLSRKEWQEKYGGKFVNFA